MSGYQIAIPSFKRPQTLQRKTLAFLRKEGFDAKDITVFLANEEERSSYGELKMGEDPVRIVVGVLGIHRQRAFIESYYPPRTRVLCLDDDLSRIKRPFNLEMPLPTLFAECFEIAARQGCALWGIYPTDHGLCLKDQAVKGFTYVIGCCHGLTTGVSIEYPNPFTEDFTRTVEYYRRGLGVLRFEGIGPCTSYFKEPGGLQEFRTPDSQEAQMLEFVEKYPALATLRKREGKMTDVRLKRIVEQVIARPFEPLDAASDTHSTPYGGQQPI